MSTPEDKVAAKISAENAKSGAAKSAAANAKAANYPAAAKSAAANTKAGGPPNTKRAAAPTPASTTTPQQQQQQQQEQPSDEELQERLNELQRELDGFEKNQKRFFIIGIAILLLVSGAIVGGVVGSSVSRRDPAPTPFPTPTPSTVPSFSVKPSLPPTTTRQGQVVGFIQTRLPDADFASPLSIQSLALQWVLEDTYSDTASADTIVQRFALATLFMSTEGNNWINGNNTWLAPSDECTTWDAMRIACDAQGRVVSLDLSSNGLMGALPPEIGLLTGLTDWRFHNNMLGMSMPTQVGLLTALTYLDMGDNLVEGAMPTEVGNLAALRSFLFSRNLLSGPIPTEVGLMTSMTDVQCFFNRFWDNIPTEFGLVTKLTNLECSQNLFRGQVPTEFGRLTLLANMSLGSNDWTGVFPSEYGVLTVLRHMDISGFSGAIGMDSTIPTVVGNMVALDFFDVNSNNLVGPLPTEIGLLTNLTTLNLFANEEMGGALPTELINLSNLVTLRLHDTELTGTIPSEICTPDNDFSIECVKIDCSCCFSFENGFQERRC